MTSKQKVKHFLHFLENNQTEIYTQDSTITFDEMRDAIIDCLKQAMADGYKQGHIEAEAAAWLVSFMSTSERS